MTYFCVCFYELHLWVCNPMIEELDIINASFTPICYPFHELQCYFVLYKNRAHCNGSFGISVNHRSGAHLFPINSSLERNNIRGLKFSSFMNKALLLGKLFTGWEVGYPLNRGPQIAQYTQIYFSQYCYKVILNSPLVLNCVGGMMWQLQCGFEGLMDSLQLLEVNCPTIAIGVHVL